MIGEYLCHVTGTAVHPQYMPIYFLPSGIELLHLNTILPLQPFVYTSVRIYTRSPYFASLIGQWDKVHKYWKQEIGEKLAFFVW